MQLFVAGRLDALIEQETRLRIDIRSVPAAPQEKENAREVVRKAAAFLEFLYFSSVFTEVATRHGAKTVRDAMVQGASIFHLVHALTNLQPQAVLAENASLVQTIPRSDAEALDQPIPDLAKVVSATESIARSCPVDVLVELATSLGIHEHGARVQVAVDGLLRFSKRNDPWIDQRLRVVGAQYAQGTLSLEAVAHILDLDFPDAVARLEDLGYTRPLEHVALKEETRTALYDKLRESRLKREGKPAPASARIVRDVIATQRIEGIDARPWIEAKLM